MGEVLIGELLDLVPSKSQVFEVDRQTGGVDLCQQVVSQVQVLEGPGQVDGVQVVEEVACHGELADPVVRGHAVRGGQREDVHCHQLGKGKFEKLIIVYFSTLRNCLI